MKMPSILCEGSPGIKEGEVVLFQEDVKVALLMPADEIGEAFFRVVFRAVVYFVANILWDLICFYIGFPVVKLVTLGKYPEGKATVAQEMITSTVGFLILLFGTMWGC